MFSLLIFTLAFGSLSSGLELVATSDNKSFFIDRTRLRDWKTAGQYCDSINKTLASITTQEEWTALEVGTNTPDFGGSFWTSGRDSLLLSQFRWNGSSTEIAESYTNFNGSAPGVMQCLYYYRHPKTHLSFLRGWLCTEELPTLCES